MFSLQGNNEDRSKASPESKWVRETLTKGFNTGKGSKNGERVDLVMDLIFFLLLRRSVIVPTKKKISTIQLQLRE